MPDARRESGWGGLEPSRPDPAYHRLLKDSARSPRISIVGVTVVIPRPDDCRADPSRTRLLLRDADQVQRLCLGRRIGRDLACHGIAFTEALMLHHPSTDRLRRNAKVASRVLHQPAAGDQLADFLAELRRELRWAMRGTLRLVRGFCPWKGGARHGQIVRVLTERTEAFFSDERPRRRRKIRPESELY
jgi:hypothetical protein